MYALGLVVVVSVRVPVKVSKHEPHLTKFGRTVQIVSFPANFGECVSKFGQHCPKCGRTQANACRKCHLVARRRPVCDDFDQHVLDVRKDLPGFDQMPGVGQLWNNFDRCLAEFASDSARCEAMPTGIRLVLANLAPVVRMFRAVLGHPGMVFVGTMLGNLAVERSGGVTRSTPAASFGGREWRSTPTFTLVG